MLKTWHIALIRKFNPRGVPTVRYFIPLFLSYLRDVPTEHGEYPLHFNFLTHNENRIYSLPIQNANHEILARQVLPTSYT